MLTFKLNLGSKFGCKNTSKVNLIKESLGLTFSEKELEAYF